MVVWEKERLPTQYSGLENSRDYLVYGVAKSETRLSNFCFHGGLVTKLCPTLATLWTVAHQAPVSMGFSMQEYWSGLPFPSPRDLPNSGIKPMSLACISCIGRQILYHCITWKTQGYIQFSSVAQLCPTLCNPMNCSTPGLPVYP